MSQEFEFLEPPRVEWHHNRPFAVARLPLRYAQTMARLALEREAEIAALPSSEGWSDLDAAENPTGSRYKSYNALTLSRDGLFLFLALRQTYRQLLESSGVKSHMTEVQAWLNIHRSGQRLRRHLHNCQFIGSFIARGERTRTAYGLTATAGPQDTIFDNADGQLLVTVGKNHHHEVLPSDLGEAARISFAFNISYLTGDREGSRMGSAIPFDGPSLCARKDA